MKHVGLNMLCTVEVEKEECKPVNELAFNICPRAVDECHNKLIKLCPVM